MKEGEDGSDECPLVAAMHLTAKMPKSSVKGKRLARPLFFGKWTDQSEKVVPSRYHAVPIF
jgi:hypothetical protein